MIKQKIHLIIIYSLLTISIMLSIFVLFYNPKRKQIIAEDIYTANLNCIVELKASKENTNSYGSAVCVGKDIFVTNAHIVIGFDTVQIRFATSENYIDGIIEKIDEQKDLAIIKVEKTNAKSVKMANNTPNEGKKVYAIGNAQNYGISIIEGIISQKELTVTADGKTITAIQCALNITDGNSGGALFNEYGELIGITTFRLKDSHNNVIYGISFAIPASVIKEFIS
jgi:serine protease Do